MKNRLRILLNETIDNCIRQGLLKDKSIPNYVIEVPNNPDHGHFATNLPLAMASVQKQPPMEIAALIIQHLKEDQHLIEKVEPATPGFVNFRISAKEWYRLLSEIIRKGEDYGRSDIGKDRKVLVEFVSANPTGPLHLGHGRGAALGDTLCRILSFCGFQVIREFYINDAGQQIRMLGESIFSRFKQIERPDYPFPEDGYQGDYILDLAKRISDEVDLNGIAEGKAIEICVEKGKELMLDEIKKDLENFRVPFDVWFKESDLYGSGLLQDTLDKISGREQLYEKDGAVWIRTSKFGDDKDRVIRKQDKQFTYFASDISYHLDKRNRGFHKAINIWGADHHGYVPRIKAALIAHGIPEDWLDIILIQLVKLWKDGHEIKMSKRAGNFVTLQELLDEVGIDAVRFVFLTKNHDSTLDFDVDLVKKRDSDNPEINVQYAHARICSLFRRAASQGIYLPKKPEGFFNRLVLKEEMALIRLMAEFPSLLEDIFEALEPHRLTYYLNDLAALFHRYFNLGTKVAKHRIVTEDAELSHARLFLAQAVKIVIANGLDLLGVTAPETM
jgi:arginyl-tRNA synthetase